jgi:hypothetical protein
MARRLVAEDACVVFLRIIDPPYGGDYGESTHPLLGDLPAGCRSYPNETVLHYGGFWAAQEVKVESNEAQDVYHLQFSYSCRIAAAVLTVSDEEISSEVEERVHSNKFPEQWLPRKEAIELVQRFWSQEEATFSEGDVLLEGDLTGALVVGPLCRSVIWSSADMRYEFRIEDCDGHPIAWLTVHLRAWRTSLGLIKHLPAVMLQSGLWVALCLLRSGKVLRMRRLRGASAPPLMKKISVI